MVSETIIETPVATDPEPEVVEQTEVPVEESTEDVAAEPEVAAVPQVEVEQAKPDYMTRADWERERGEVATRAAADALETDRRQRQTANARKAKQDAEQIASDQEAVDTLKAALGAKGIYEVPEDAALAAINRIATKKAERLANASMDTVEQAWDYLTAPAYGKKAELDDSFMDAATRLGPKVQHLINTIRPVIEAQAREGYVAESDLPKRFEAMQAAKNAKGRQGQEELKRVESTPSASGNTLAAWDTRVAHQGEEGYPMLTDADWRSYNQIRKQNGL